MRYKFRTTLFFSLYSSFFLIFSSQVSAQVTITEVYPYPLTGESEWVELYNQASESANLSGWVIEDQLSAPSTIHTITDLILQSFTHVVIEISGSKLNNSADGVTLKDPSGQVIDQMSYESSEAGKSWGLTKSNRA